jgi:predicted O-methyltransferase YrrM
MIDFTETIHPEAEMLPLERKALYDSVVLNRPKVILEVGTGCGGGGTYFMSRALKDNNIDCILYTCDPMRGPDQSFLEDFPFVNYRSDYSINIIRELIEKDITPDFLFFDGPEDPLVALNDLKALETVIKEGTILCIHDYDLNMRGYDKAYSTKSKLIRPYLESSDFWDEVLVYSGTEKNSDYNDEEFDSVGFAIFKYNP